MNNWFESNPFRSVFLYTLTIAGITWGAFHFIFDENKLESSRMIIDQYKSKYEIVTEENDRLIEQNNKYLRWLENKPDSIPYLESKIKSLEKELNIILEQLYIVSRRPEARMPALPPPASPGLASYDYEIKNLKMGEIFVDKLTGAVLNIIEMKPLTVDLMLILPAQGPRPIKDAKAETSWKYKYNSLDYKITLLNFNWYRETFSVKVTGYQRE